MSPPAPAPTPPPIPAKGCSKTPTPNQSPACPRPHQSLFQNPVPNRRTNTVPNPIPDPVQNPCPKPQTSQMQSKRPNYVPQILFEGRVCTASEKGPRKGKAVRNCNRAPTARTVDIWFPWIIHLYAGGSYANGTPNPPIRVTKSPQTGRPPPPQNHSIGAINLPAG